MRTVDLLDNYFIEQKPSGCILKQRYWGTRKGTECQCEKIISYHAAFEDAGKAFLSLYQGSKTEDRFLSLQEYLASVEQTNAEAVEIIQGAKLQHFYMDIPKANPRPKKEGISILELIPYGKENAIKRRELLKLCLQHRLVRMDTRDPDRAMRDLINKERIDNAVSNDQDGKGYYRPTKSDAPELGRHIKQEESRAINIFRALKVEKALYEDFKADRL